MLKIPEILEKISDSGLVGRGGAAYPTAAKWAAVKDALATKRAGYIVVNGAEGEPGVKKDGYIFKNYPEEVINGVLLADKFLGPAKIKKIYIYLNHDYYRDYAPRLKKILVGKKYQALGRKAEFFLKPDKLTYISGEETTILNLIEGKMAEPRLKPPFPTKSGLHHQPTLINNPETFYNVSLAARDEYRGERFYTINGAVKKPGVYPLPAELNIEEVLRRTGNYPSFPFFVQIGGEASGEVLNSSQLVAPVEGAGSIMVYDATKTDHKKLVNFWLNFYRQQSCGQCTPCREGTYRLTEMFGQKDFDKKLFWKTIETMEKTSFCALGSSLAVPLKSYYQNVLKK
jgi:NADH:ubiquinone oxidoreductase subunit F (NADH-binding)